MDADQPEGGKWNYDADNRTGWREQCEIRRDRARARRHHARVIARWRPLFRPPGDLSTFRGLSPMRPHRPSSTGFVSTRCPPLAPIRMRWPEESPWLFHGLISMYLNCGLLDPLPVCEQVEAAYRRGHCSLSAAEGFIRQVLGWREYVRGLYWHHMPDYRECNALSADRPLPEWFWTGDTEMRCLSQALRSRWISATPTTSSDSW
ncbi:MAG: hypothetical protein CM15mP74_18340 [Halieaceae bacterium]|nr:MAG: hypothetical protein CM15mP74_18340 [Halieaceae bacterium]